MSKFKIVFVFFLSLAFLTCLFAAEKPRITVVSDAGTQIVLNYKIEDYRTNTFKLGEEEYTNIFIPGEANFMEKGEPALPHINRSIIIPDNQRMIVKVLSAHYEEKLLKIAPSKGRISRSIDPGTVPYEFGPVYAIDRFYPGPLATLGEPYIMRDHRGLVVQINPFQYNPVTGIMRIYKDVTVEVSAAGPGGVNLFERKGKVRAHVRAFEDIYRSHFLNYTRGGEAGSLPEGASNLLYDPMDEQGDMLIIAYDQWISNLDPFVQHKTMMGITANVVGISTIGNDPTSIKNYIQNVYDTSDLAWVLLVGDAAQVATPISSGGASDPSYAKLAGSDHYPEIIVGRFSAQSAAEVDTQVQRTIDYEGLPANEQDWFWKGIAIASAEGAGQGDEGQSDQQHEEQIRQWLLAFGYTQVDQIYDPGATDTMVANALNQGRGIINYTGHGSATSWGTTGFNNTDVDALVNDSKLPFIISVACNNGEFNNYSKCFGEAWLRATNGSTGAPTGAIGAYMSSISQSWAPPMEGQDEFNLVYTDPAEPYFSYGAMCFAGSCSMMDAYGSGGVEMYDTWIIFGDPSLRILGTASKLVYDSHTIDDSDPDYGNGDGNIDFGETVRMTVTLRNNRTEPATDVWAVLTTTSTGIEIRDAVAYYPDVPGSGTAQSSFPHFTFTVHEGCGTDIKFRMEIHHDDGLTSFASIVVRSGLRIETVYFEDTMETDMGWTVSGTEEINNWVREDPNGVNDGFGNVIQPEDDTTPAPGVKAWVTGNPVQKGKFVPADGDVDAIAILESPVFSASGAVDLALEYDRFCFRGQGQMDSSYCNIAISNDGGSTYTSLEQIESQANEWTTKTFELAGLLVPTGQMRMRFQLEQISLLGDVLLEGAVDDVRCWGTHYVCESFSMPPASPPNPVGGSLMVNRERTDLKLTWQAPPVDAGHDAATFYNVYKSDHPNGDFTLIATTTATFYIDGNECERAVNCYYKIIAENGGGASE